MTKVEAIIRPNRFEQVKEALAALGVEGMTVSEVRGHGRQKGQTENYRGREYDISLLPKLKLETVVGDDRVEEVIEAIIKSANTGEIGDGKIFLYKADDAIRIRNQQRGEGCTLKIDYPPADFCHATLPLQFIGEAHFCELSHLGRNPRIISPGTPKTLHHFRSFPRVTSK